MATGTVPPVPTRVSLQEAASMLKRKCFRESFSVKCDAGPSTRKRKESRRVSFNSKTEDEKRKAIEDRQQQEEEARLEAGAGNLPCVVPSVGKMTLISDENVPNTAQDFVTGRSASGADDSPKLKKTKPANMSIWQRLHSSQVNPETGRPEKFKALVKSVKMNLLWGKDRVEKIDKSDDMDAFVVTTKERERLLFDKNRFKVKSQTYGGLSNKARQTLMIHPLVRSDADLQYLRDVVERLKSFKKYNRKVKNELARVLHYEEFDDGRVIVQQGHAGMAFYFIISGTVVVKMTETDKKTGRTKTQILGELMAGSSFGELALIHNIKRSATIVCKDHCEFLRVDKEDFEEVLMKCYQREWKERLFAINWLPACATWSVEERESASRLSQLKDYGTDQLVYGNVNHAEPDYIYFLISGKVCLVRHVLLGVKTEPYGVRRYDLVSRLSKRGIDACKTRTQYDRRCSVRKGEVYLRESHFWTIGNMYKGFYFSIGEDFRDLYVVTKSRCEFLMVPRAQFTKFGYGRLMEKMAEDLMAAIPSEEDLFTMYFEEAKWGRYKQDVVCEVVRRSKIPRTTTMDDVPDAVKKESWRIGMNPEYQAL